MNSLFLILSIVSLSKTAFSQNEDLVKVQVEQKVNDLFKAMKTSDSILVRTIFTNEAVFKTTLTQKDGSPAFHEGNVKEFIDAVSKPKNDIWDERISELRILIDDNLAIAWMNYSFYLNDNFSHCGVNAIELIKTKEGWRISNLTDTRRKENCN